MLYFYWLHAGPSLVLVGYILLDENVYIVYILSPLTTTDFRISDSILKVVNAIIE